MLTSIKKKTRTIVAGIEKAEFTAHNMAEASAVPFYPNSSSRVAVTVDRHYIWDAQALEELAEFLLEVASCLERDEEE